MTIDASMRVKTIKADEFMASNQRRFGASDPRDKAVIRKPPSYFEKLFNFHFEDARDDLDDLKRAAFSVNDDLVFALSLYRRQPDQNGTTLLMERRYSNAEVATILSAIHEAFRLAPSDIEMLE
jgi:hypothetical protein